MNSINILSILSHIFIILQIIPMNNVGRDQMKFKHEDFSHISESTLAEVGVTLPKKALEILVGNPNLSL